MRGGGYNPNTIFVSRWAYILGDGGYNSNTIFVSIWAFILGDGGLGGGAYNPAGAALMWYFSVDKILIHSKSCFSPESVSQPDK